MQNSNLNLLEQMSTEIGRIGIMFSKIGPDNYDHNAKEAVIRESVVDSLLPFRLDMKNWNKILSSDSLEEKLMKHNFNNEILNNLFDYPHINQVSEEEWAELFTHQSFLKAYEEDGANIREEWLLPLTLQAIKLPGVFSDNMENMKTNMDAHNLLRRRSALQDHFITMKLLSLMTEHNVSFQLFETLAEMYGEGQDNERFAETCELLLSYSEVITAPVHLNHFKEGVQKISKHLTAEQIKTLQEKFGVKFAEILMTIGDEVKIELNEKTVNHLFHKEGDVLDVLFHPYGEMVNSVTKRAERRPAVYSRGYSQSDTAKDQIIKFVQYLALNKKKGFFRLMEETEFDLAQVKIGSMLINPHFYKLVNVNTLNPKALTRIAETKISNKQFEDMTVEMTFQEFEFLNTASKLHIDMFGLIVHMKVDERIRLLNLLPKVIYKDEYLVDYAEFQQLLLESMKEKGFQLYNEMAKELSISLQGALFYHLFGDKWISVLGEVKTDQDIDLLMTYPLIEGETLLGMKQRIYKDLPIINEFKEFMDASEDFIESNLSNFYRFYEKGLMNAVIRYKKHINDKQAFNLRLLCKAEIAGKLREVKYRDEDFAKEIGITPTHVEREGWKRDLIVNAKNMVVTETSDFYDLFNFGVIPTETCQSWATGSYRQCLLSIFDLNKKVIVVKQGDKVVARAILRLTKIKTKKKENSDLGFVDIENENISDSTVDLNNPGEKIVMFLERFYTTHTGDERNQMIRAVVALAEQKAKDMKIELLYAYSYEKVKTHAKEVTVPMFISRSKNGNQYLDSLGGQADEEEGGKYHTASVFRLT